jgi:hypothetical protein
LLNKSSCFAPALGVTKFTIVTNMIWSHLVVLLKSHLDVQQTHLWRPHVEQAELEDRETWGGFDKQLSET